MPQSNSKRAARLRKLRSRRDDLTRRAEAKIAEVRDGMSAEQVRSIEEEHAALIEEVAEVVALLAEAEQKAAEAVSDMSATLNGDEDDDEEDEGDAENRSDDPDDDDEDGSAGQRHRGGHVWRSRDIRRIQSRAAAFGLDAAAAIAVMSDRRVRSVEAATDALQQRAAQGNASRQRPHARVTRDEGDTVRTAVESAILLRANPQAIRSDAPERQMAQGFRGMSLLEIGRSYIEDTQGVRLRGLSRMDLAGALLGINTRAAGMHSTSDFGDLLANVATKRLRAAYDNAPQHWRRISRQSNNPDFKEKSVVQLSSGPAFKLVREGEEYSYGALTDGVEKYALATYGRIITITRQTLINDDLSAFDRLPTLLGRQAAELEASVFWRIFTDNPAMGDGVPLFHANHGNRAAAGTPIDEAGLTAAKAAMRKQKSLAAKAADREPLNLTPQYLVVSPDKEVEAMKMLTAVTANSAQNVNVFSNSLELIVEARLEGHQWYLSADPAVIDTIEYSYLEGEEGVFIEQQVGFDVDGIKIKGRLDFAAKAIDWRGLYMNEGAPPAGG